MPLVQKYKSLFIKFFANLSRPRFGLRNTLRNKYLKALYLIILFPIEVLGDLVFFWKRFGRSVPSSPRKILIVKVDQFGDLLFSTFLLPIIKRHHPQSEIDFVINPKAKDVLAGNPNIGKVFFWEDPFLFFLKERRNGKEQQNDNKQQNDKKRRNSDDFFSACRSSLRTLRLIRKEKYDIVINARAYLPSQNIFWSFTGAKFLISFDIAEASFLANHWARYDLKQDEWKNYLHLIQPFCKDALSASFEPHFYSLDDAGLEIALPHLPKLSQPKLAVISPASFEKEKGWNRDAWRNLLIGLHERGYLAVLTGLPSHEGFLRNLVRDLHVKNLPAKDMSAKKLAAESWLIATNLTIPQLASLMKKASFFIGIESFPAHLAIAFHKEVFTLLNTNIYYLKGKSKKTWIDGRSMLPVIPSVHVFSNKNTKPADILLLIKNANPKSD